METNVTVIRKDTYRVMNTASVLDKIFKVLQGFAIAGMIVAAVFMILTAIFGEKIIADASSVDFTGMELELTGDRAAYLNMPWVMGHIYASLASLLICCGAAWFGLKLLRGILGSMKEGEVFAEGISKKVRNLGTTVLVGGGIAEICMKVCSVIEMRAYNWDVILNKSVVSGIEYGAQLNTWFIIAALVIYFLSFVFRCGERLQKESDETL